MPVKNQKLLIIESGPTDMLAKMAFVLRKKGYKTSLLSLTGNLETDFLKDAYDERISLDFKFFKLNLKNSFNILLYGIKKSMHLLASFLKIVKIRPQIVIVRTTPNWLFFIAKKFFRKSPVIYFPYDIRSFGYKSINDMISSGIPQFEINAENYCFKNADGIIHKGDENELNFLNKKILGDIKIKCPSLHFLPYCLSEFNVTNENKLSRKDNEIHIVFVGHVDTDKTWIDSINNVLKEKIHLHLYDKNLYLSGKSEDSDKYSLLPKNKYLHIHMPVDQKKLSREISKYDYGTWLVYYDFDGKNIDRGTVNMGTGNKLASYLEAGLPVIYFKNYEYIGKILEKFGAGVALSKNQSLKKELKTRNYSKLAKNVEKARNNFEMHHQISQLEKLFTDSKKYSLKTR